ncbi:MAG: hypothetical protein SF066_12340, partial [Thermoanaerobaculia bacterium]|nr:hypothetical protein [Thermoanaerobaculia bacterium]
YMNDDFQVRTPTDIIAQHIHLVKFDVTSSDGGGNGFNYEDGTFAPEEVQERIHAIRTLNACPEGFVQTVHADGRIYCPQAKVDPRFGEGPDVNCDGHRDYLGAQTTVQRWYADPQMDLTNNDRTLRTVFTHDHFGPSTHQQIGLYAGLVIEPRGSLWYHNETNAALGTTSTTPTGDGSPTSWQAVVVPEAGASFREFLLEFSDFQLAYERQWPSISCPDPVLGWANPAYAINPPGREDVGPHALYYKPDLCPINPNDTDGSLLPGLQFATPTPPCPEAVSADDPGFAVVNYRAEPLASRIKWPGAGQTSGPGGDLSYAYQTRTDRPNAEFNKLPYNTGNPATGLQYVPYPALTGSLFPGDPFTPVLRSYEGDTVKIRTLVGGFEEEHSMTLHANRWLYEPDDPHSGFKSAQMNGISEWFDLDLAPVPLLLDGSLVDVLYKASAAAEWQWTGLWGLFRVHRNAATTEATFGPLAPLPQNPKGSALTTAQKAAGFKRVKTSTVVPTQVDLAALVGPERKLLSVPGTEKLPEEPGTPGIPDSPLRPYPYDTDNTDSLLVVNCPPGAPSRTYSVAAVAAREVLPAYGAAGKSLVFNPRTTSVNLWGTVAGGGEGWNGTVAGPLHDPTAILFVPVDDLDFVNSRPRLKSTAPVEPLILRASAGECVTVTLANLLPPSPTGWGYDLDGWNGWHMLYQDFNANDVRPSMEVSLHPQLVHADPTRSDGTNVGMTPAIYSTQSVAPGGMITYYWYAGRVTGTASSLVGTAIEYGATGLSSSDPISHSNKSAVGALIIEPAGSTWATTDIGPYLPTEPATRITRASATVTKADASTFREFVAVFQNDLNLRYGTTSGTISHPDDPLQPVQPYHLPIQNLQVLADPTESGQKAFNFRTEPIWFRMGYSPNTPPSITRGFDFANVFTDTKVGGRPVTPIFRANPGQEVRFRVVEPGGHTQAHVWEVAGHVWPERPYTTNSLGIGNQVQSQWQGARPGIGPGHHSDTWIPKAGGAYQVPAQYLYKDYVNWGLSSGLWGIFAVGLP